MDKPKKQGKGWNPIAEESYNQFIGDSSNLPNDQVINDIFLSRKTQHAEDAVDYEDIDELADDDEIDLNDEQESRIPHDDVDNNEGDLQEQADEEFDNMFGNDGGEENNMDEDKFGSYSDNNNRLFNDLNNTDNLVDDDGFHDLNMGGIFEDDIQNRESHSAQPDRKRARPLELEENRRLKKQKLARIVKKLEERNTKKSLAYYFPNYAKDKPFNNHTLFLPSPKYYSYLRPPIALKSNVKPLIPNKLSLKIDVDKRKLFKDKKLPLNDSSENAKNNIINITSNYLDIIEELEKKGVQKVSNLNPISFLSLDGTNNDKFSEFSKDLILSTTYWDDDAIINAGDKKYDTGVPVKVEQRSLDMESDYEEDENIFNGQITEKNLKLDMNDPNLLFVPDKSASEKTKSKAVIPTNEKLLEMKFNISNDKEYEILKNNYNTKVRSQLSNLNIEHSIPALRLQTPYYRVKLTKEEARSFHRPKFNVRPGTLISFSKLKLRKKKKDRGKTSQEIFTKSSDLTTSDTSALIGMEYAEEYPQILSNFGMGSKLINYYRKEKEDDNSRPKAPLGETHVLGVEDRSPFWNFGHVAKGDFVPTLYNNMVRAPVFKHDTTQTDFLLVRSQGAGNHQKYFLRNINHLFAVGNTFPAVEVPAPHSRKVTNTSKNRLKMIVFRAMNMNDESRVSVKTIAHHFPDQNDMQNRQRLKEFMEYQKHGEDQGYWKIKNTDIVPSEDEIRSMITPEDVALLDSMHYGQQTLDYLAFLLSNETGSKKEDIKKENKKDKSRDENTSDGEKEKDKPKEKNEKEKKSKLKDKDNDKDRDRDLEEEEELAPWNLTRNFVNANQTKAMLQLNGEGDPTGIGLGFSFFRSTQKSSFTPLFAPVKENVPKNNTAAYQQKLYENEVSRIWYAQRRSLTVDQLDGHDLSTVYNEYKPADHDRAVKHKIAKDKDIAINEEIGSAENKALRITRRFRDENGIVQRRVDTITDPRLIRAYIRRRKQIEDELLRNAEVDDIIPTNDKELNKLRRKALEEKLASLEKKAKLGKGRKPSKDVLHIAAAAGGKVIDANTVMLPDGSYAFGGKGIGKGKSKTRRCASCGAFGHIRTNKSCPLFYQNNEKEASTETNTTVGAETSVPPPSFPQAGPSGQ